MTRSRPLIGQPSFPTIWWWCGAVQCCAVRNSAVRCGVVRRGAVRCGAVRCGEVRCGAVRCGCVCEKTKKKKRKKIILFCFVSALLAASVERVGVSRMRDFYSL